MRITRPPMLRLSSNVFAPLLFALALSSSSRAASDLVWNASEVFLRVTAKDKVAVAEYFFRNTGRGTVRIISVAPSCECVVAAADKPAYGPGEAGVIRAEFTIGGREGKEERFVNVFTDDAPDQPKRLLLTVDIPQPLMIHPRVLTWKIGAPITEQKIAIVCADPGTSKLEEVRCADSTFTILLEKLAVSGRYTISVKPARTDKLVQATIRLDTVIGGQSRAYVVYAF